MRRHQGFTLIELMVVVTIIGIMAGLIAINAVTTDPQKKLNQEATRLKAVVEMAEEQALFGREDIGIVFKDNTYSFVQYGVPADTSSGTDTGSKLTSTSDLTGSGDSSSEASTNQLLAAAAANKPQQKPEWMAMDQQQFKHHKIPDDYGISLQVDDQDVDPSGGTQNTNSNSPLTSSNSLQSAMADDNKPVPSIYISPSGEITPFVLEIYLKDNSDITVKVSGDETGRIWIGDDTDEDN